MSIKVIILCKYLKDFQVQKEFNEMSLKPEVEAKAAMAKNYVMNCQDLDDDYKENLINLISVSTMATNGISPEEKIQKITESIQNLAISQVGLLKSIKNIIIDTITDQNKNIDNRIITAITKANTRQCNECAAMKFTKDMQKEKEKQDIINDFIRQSGITQAKKDTTGVKKDKNDEEEGFSVKYFLNWVKEILLKPQVWIFFSVLAVSPYGYNIIKLIIDSFASK